MSRTLRRDVAHWEAIVRETDGAGDEDSLERRALASFRLGHAFFGVGRYEESVEHSALAATILVRFPPLHAVTVHALALQGGALFMLGRDEESVAVCDQVIAVRNPAPELLDQLEPGLSGIAVRRRDYIADAWWTKAAALDRLGRLQEADASAKGLIEEFDPGETPPQRYVIAGAFLRRGRLARARGDLAGALAALEGVLVRCAEPESDKFAHIDCMAVFERGSVLEEAGRNDEAVAAYDELVTRFSSMKDPDIREAVADATRLQSKLVDRATSDTGP